ncbi:hypothetical protein J6590_059816 [Homalodisca vitripennis]|nr:hypothetical protein J6590_059816 [Homalodisca vitripennis]
MGPIFKDLLKRINFTITIAFDDFPTVKQKKSESMWFTPVIFNLAVKDESSIHLLKQEKNKWIGSAAIDLSMLQKGRSQKILQKQNNEREVDKKTSEKGVLEKKNRKKGFKWKGLPRTRASWGGTPFCKQEHFE